MTSPLVDALLAQLPPHIRVLASGYVSKAAADPTIQAVGTFIAGLAEQDEMSVADYVSSGRVIQVLGSMALGHEVPPTSAVTVDIHKCPKCSHVGYLVTK